MNQPPSLNDFANDQLGHNGANSNLFMVSGYFNDACHLEIADIFFGIEIPPIPLEEADSFLRLLQ